MYSIIVNVSKQLLTLYDEKPDGQRIIVAEYPVSTSKFGTGNKEGSFKTPLGRHQITEKIGDGMAEDEVFIGRLAKGRISTLNKKGVALPEDIITARILRLSGMEAGVNHGEGVDSFDRYIYIHGTDDEVNISKPVSHGCVRMRNHDIMELYDQIEVNTDVLIEA